MKKFIDFYKELEASLVEDRKEDIKYTPYKKGLMKIAAIPEETDSIVAELKENEAGQVTKIVNKFVELQDKAEQVDEEIKKMRPDLERLDLDYFNLDPLTKATDAVYTRFLKTGKVALQFSKMIAKEKDEAKIEDVKKAFDDIAELILENMPTLIDQLEEIRKATIKVKTTEPKRLIRAEKMEEGFMDKLKAAAEKFVNFMKIEFADVINKINIWAPKYDHFLDEAENKLTDLELKLEGYTKK